ncbi:hypothetical protein KY309_03240 [Candidatus Woesearchaeota archaeon]|nr:hypothetical protein [Candidatus Woesearchaeota archaeon]
MAAKTEKIFAAAEKKKPSWIMTVDVALFWVLLLMAILANFILSVVLVPFLLILKGWTLYFSLFFVAASFGFVFTFILHSLEKVEKQRHVVASVFIPCLALINVGIFAVLSNKLIILLKLATPPHNPLLVGAVYVLGYVLPSSVFHLRKK